MPHTWSAVAGNLSCENGMRTSATQPSSSMLVAASQTPSQELSLQPSV